MRILTSGALAAALCSSGTPAPPVFHAGAGTVEAAPAFWFGELAVRTRAPEVGMRLPRIAGPALFVVPRAPAVGKPDDLGPHRLFVARLHRPLHRAPRARALEPPSDPS